MQNQISLNFDGPLALMTVEEIYSQASHSLLLQLMEDRRVERKAAGIHSEDLGDYISMWANTAPDGGIVVIGMENNGSVSGCSRLSVDQLNRIEKARADFAPDARWETKRIEAVRADGTIDYLLVVRVYYRHDKVVTTNKGNAYIRVGDSIRKLTAEEVRELEIDKGQIDFELEPCGLPYPEEFDSELIRKFCDSYIKARGLENTSDITILELNHLGKRKGEMFIPNVACCLLFAKDPVQKFPGCKIRFFRFESEYEATGERFNAVKDIWLEGNIPSLILKAETVLDSQLREFSQLGKDGRFYTAPEYPKAAWYEVVVNACVHRSYGLRTMNIFIKMFADRLEVESPGPFPPLVTKDNVYEMHKPRNPYLMDALFYLDFVKCAHEGARRIRNKMLEMSLPAPEFVQKQAFGTANLKVILRNDVPQRRVWVDSGVGSTISESLAKQLGQEEIRAINFVREYGTISVSEVQRLTDKTWPAAKKLLMSLVDKGILEHKIRRSLDRDPQARFVLKNTPSTN